MIRILITLFFMLLCSVNSFVNNNKNINKMNRLKPIKINNMNDFDPFNPLDFNQKFDSFNKHVLTPFNHDFINLKTNLIQNSHCWIHDQSNMIGKEIVLKISSLLPNFDSVGHQVLHANNELILKILTNHHLSELCKRILFYYQLN